MSDNLSCIIKTPRIAGKGFNSYIQIIKEQIILMTIILLLFIGIT